MKKIVFLCAVVAVMLAFTGCGTTKQVVQDVATKDTAAVNVVEKTAKTYHVDAHPEVISIAEAITLLTNKDAASVIAKKYKYKMKAPYGIYRLDRYDTMLYKNCRLPRALAKNIYEDSPKPQAKGTSSYVAIDSTITVAVFNNKAYDNLLEQVKGLGFTLAETGYEDRYTNGVIDIYCYGTRKSVRIEKTL